MFRYRLTVYYEEKATESRVAQTVVVVGEDDRSAIRTATAEVAKDAVGGRIHTLKVVEKDPVKPGVVYRSDPYIPFQWLGALASAGPAPPPQPAK